VVGGIALQGGLGAAPYGGATACSCRRLTFYFR
jgi:hypothetical protein